MEIIILIVLIILFVISNRFIAEEKKSDNYNRREPTAAWGARLAVISAIIILFLVMCLTVQDVVTAKYLPQQISMYQQENNKIEADVNIIVSNYLKHESQTFNMSKITSPIVLIQLYPELKSNALVSKQIDIYCKNNNKIKQLKNEYIEANVSRWWLYFNI